MDSIRAVGFDMDYTLAIYDDTDLETLAFRLAAPKLTDRGYPPMVGSLRYRPMRGIRGLIVDLECGNVLKVDQYDHVSIAWHGVWELDPGPRRETYANQRIDFPSKRYVSVDTLFALPNLDLFLQLVALRDAQPKAFHQRSYRDLWKDVREVIDEVHQDGILKAEVLANVETYLHLDPELPRSLATLRSHGKKLFLLTNSGFHFTQGIMSYLLDGRLKGFPTWVDYFDEVVVSAHKPGFFTGKSQCEVVAKLPRSKGRDLAIHQGGNYRELHQRIGHQGDAILFVGDHIYGDVIRSKRELFWRTLMILPELQDELAGISQSVRQRVKFLQLLERIEKNDVRCANLRAKVERKAENQKKVSPRLATRYKKAQQRAKTLQELVLRLEGEIDRTFHPRWGALLNDGGEISRFGKQVLHFADLYTSRVPNLSRYPEGKLFQSPWDTFPHSQLPCD
jgi:HAD superfamily 5'-nucleotidase-like hydrolase